MTGSSAGVRARNSLIAVGCLLLVACIVALHYLAGKKGHWQPWSTIGFGIGAILLGIAIIRTFVAIIGDSTVDYLGAARVRSVRSVIAAALYIVLGLTVASQAQFDLSGIALSGAVTGVIVGIAAQASIANVVAGLVILFARPFRSGQYVTVRASAFAGSEYSGVVGEITLFYTSLFSGKQEIRVPNSSMVTSVVTLRAQLLDVYLPVILSSAQWEQISTSDLSQRLSSALPPDRDVTVLLERMEAGNMQIGVHASVANEEERSVLETALGRAIEAVTSPAMS